MGQTFPGHEPACSIRMLREAAGRLLGRGDAVTYLARPRAIVRVIWPCHEPPRRRHINAIEAHATKMQDGREENYDDTKDGRCD